MRDRSEAGDDGAGPDERAAGEEREPPLRPATPREVAIRILDARFGSAVAGRQADAMHRPVFDLARFQADAVARAEAILAARGGVVIADGVGLGKTFVALALIERALRGGERVAVSSPAALRATWAPPLRRLARALDVRDAVGLGVDGRRRSAAGPALAWVSHTRLSRGTHRPGRLGPVDLVVVDEAHAFRNPRTRRYRALASLCVGAHVVLLTATPVNNSPMDLYALLRLFASDGAFRDAGVPDLREAFRAAMALGPATGRDVADDRRYRPADDDDGNDGVPPSLGPVLRAVVIRRSRAFLRAEYGGIEVPVGARSGGRWGAWPAGAFRLDRRRRERVVLRFPRRAPPVPVRYASAMLFAPHDSALALLEDLTFAPFRWPDYTTGARRARRGEPELLRLTLLKRLESGVDALRASVRRQLRFHGAFLDALGRDRLLAPADFQALFTGADDGDAVQLVLDDVVLRPLPAGLAVADLADAVRRDEECLWRLHRLLTAIAPSKDPKLERLRALLTDEVGDGRVLIFTEFRTTARYLWRALRHDRAVALVDGSGARLGDRRCARRAAILRFAPRANGAREPHPRERVDTLVATDVLAEGLDLHDADRVVSYDLPWNPVRLIQRVGRVDRLGSEHARVHSYHFLPADGLERFLRILARLRWKLGAIARTVGGGAALAGATAPARSFDALVDRLAAGDPDALDTVERNEARPLEVEDRLFAAYRRAAGSAGTGRLTGANIGRTAAPGPETEPVRRRMAMSDGSTGEAATSHSDDPVPDADAVPVALLDDSRGGAGGALVAVRTAGHVTVWIHRGHGRTTRGAADASELLRRALAARSEAVPDPDAKRVRRAIDAVRAEVARVAVTRRAAEPVHARSGTVRAARALVAAVAEIPGDPDPMLCRRVDRLLEWLAAGHDAGTEHALRITLDEHERRPVGDERTAALVDRIDRLRARDVRLARSPSAEMTAPHAGRSKGSTGETTGEISGGTSTGSPARRLTERRPGSPIQAAVIGVIALRPTATDHAHGEPPPTG